MEDELRLLLLLGGTVFIIGVLAHGIWKIRKNSGYDKKARAVPPRWAGDIDGADESDDASGSVDEFEVSNARVIGKNVETQEKSSDYDFGNSDIDGAREDGFDSTIEGTEQNGQSETQLEMSHHDSDKVNIDNDDSDGEGREEPDVGSEHTHEAEKPKLYGSVVSNPKPHMKATQMSDNVSVTTSSATNFPEPPGFLLKDDAVMLANDIDEPNNNSSLPVPEQSVASEDTQSSVTQARNEPKLYVEPVIEPETTDATNQTQSVPDFSLDAPKAPENEAVNTQNSDANSKRLSRTKRTKPGQRKEPNFGKDQMHIDFDTNEGTEGLAAHSGMQDETSARARSGREAAQAVEQEVLVLNVRAPEGEVISGAALLPMLLTLGFKFGDQDIFHRHVNSNGKGPVLFSLANMFKPGVFDIDNLENFETQGVSLFMILPIEGDPHQVFNMMHNAARKLADEFSAQVLDGRRSVLTKQGLQQYVEKIREFERKRIIARS